MMIDSFMAFRILRLRYLKSPDEKLIVANGMIYLVQKNVVEKAIDKLKEVFNGR